MVTDEGFLWDDRYLVGHHGVDDAHREFAALVDAMLVADDASAAPAMAAIARHIESHFALEDRLMERYAFPARQCHADEHARVRASVKEVEALVAAGRTELCRDLGEALADWFPGHSDYMDSALAIWVAKKTTNGAPVVLRRARQAPRPTPTLMLNA
jgi:hemerythrin